MEFTITPMQPSDWPQVSAIYFEGILTRNATFETTLPTWEKWDAGHLPAPRLVARSAEAVLGWAALSPVSSRKVYAGVAEVSVYVGERYRGHAIGGALLGALVEQSEQARIWTLQAAIFPENEASLKLHKKFGFRLVGRREKIAQLDGVWRDTVLLERRSQVVGTWQA